MSSSPTLLSRTSAPDYLMQVSETALRIEVAADPTEAVELLEEAAARLGTDAAVFVSSMTDDNGQSSSRYLVACDPSWLVAYEQHVAVAEDRWLSYASVHSDPIRISDLEQRATGGPHGGMFAERFGFRSAVLVPVTNARFARFGALYLGSDVPGYFEADGYATFKVGARVLAAELHEWWLSFLRKDMLARARLTNEEIFLLAEERRASRPNGLRASSVSRRRRSIPAFNGSTQSCTSTTRASQRE